MQLVQSLNEFLDFIVASPFVDQLSEYNVPGTAIGHGARLGSAIVTSPRLSTAVADQVLRQMLQREISSRNGIPEPTANTVYFVFLAPGTVLTAMGGRSCQTFCAYHDNIDERIFYAAIPYPGCGGCTGGLTVRDALTVLASHQLAEQITDPVAGKGWYDDVSGEVGDVCAWKTESVGKYTVQQVWSNRKGGCGSIRSPRS